MTPGWRITQASAICAGVASCRAAMAVESRVAGQVALLDRRIGHDRHALPGTRQQIPFDTAAGPDCRAPGWSAPSPPGADQFLHVGDTKLLTP